MAVLPLEETVRQFGPCRALVAALVAAGALAGSPAVALARPGVGPGPHARAGLRLYVSPSGSDLAPGTARRPLRSLQRALDLVRPGGTIVLAAGTYIGSATTVRDGTAAHPITIEGADAADGPHTTVLEPTSADHGHAIDVNNSYYVIRGFAIEGEPALTAAAGPYPTDPTVMNAWKKTWQGDVRDVRLIYVDDTAADVTGITINDMFLEGSGGECVRFRDGANDSVVENSVIEYCGLYGKSDSAEGSENPFHNGEGVYVGTSDVSTNEPDYLDDDTNNLTITHDVIRTYGSECVDIKENANHITVSDSLCGDNLESLADGGSNLEVRGDHNTIVGNTITWSAGYGVKLWTDAATWDRGGNVVEDNTISLDSTPSALGVPGGPNITDHEHGVTVCGNTLDGTTPGVAPGVASGACPT